MEHEIQNQFRVTPIVFLTPARAAPNFRGVSEPDFAAQFFQQSFEPAAVTTGLESDDHVALELGVESAHFLFVLVLKFVELDFSTLSCQITDRLLSCMKVNADIYCVHSASFRSHDVCWLYVYYSRGG